MIKQTFGKLVTGWEEMIISLRANGAGVRPELDWGISLSGDPDIRTVTGRTTACSRSSTEKHQCGSTPTVLIHTTIFVNTSKS